MGSRCTKWRRTGAWITFLCASLGLLSGGATVAPAGAVTGDALPHLRPDGHVTVAWLYGGSSTDYRAQVEAAAGLTTLSPTWWYLDEDDPGGVNLSTDDELVGWAQARGQAVWPLLGNRINPDLTDQVLRDPALRQRLVDAVVAETRRSGVDGVNVDFENLHDRTAGLLTTFVAELKTALPDLIISVDVTAMTDTWVLGNWSTAFDREGLGQVADYVMLMAYDQHNSLRRDGPVAGLDWVTESTDFLLRTVPAHKIVLGLPFYSRDWATDPDATDGVALDSTLGMAAMAGRMAERSQGVTFDEAAGQDLHTYTDTAGRPHRVWLEDVASLQRKTELVRSRGLAGIAAWRAGFEQPEVWTALDGQLSAIPAPTPVQATADGGSPLASTTDAQDTGLTPAGQDAAEDAQTAGAADGAAVADGPPEDGVALDDVGVTPQPGAAEAMAQTAPEGAQLASALPGEGIDPARRRVLRSVAATILITVLLSHAILWRRRPGLPRR